MGITLEQLKNTVTKLKNYIDTRGYVSKTENFKFDELYSSTITNSSVDNLYRNIDDNKSLGENIAYIKAVLYKLVNEEFLSYEEVTGTGQVTIPAGKTKNVYYSELGIHTSNLSGKIPISLLNVKFYGGSGLIVSPSYNRCGYFEECLDSVGSNWSLTFNITNPNDYDITITETVMTLCCANWVRSDNKLN